MGTPQARPDDPEATAAGEFFFDEEAERRVLSREELHRCLSALIRSCAGCENVTVIDTTRLEKPEPSGCNWSASIVLDPGGVAPELYALAWASVIAGARASWNLE